MDIRTDREGQKQKRLEVVAERVCLLDGTGVIRTAIPREPVLDASGQIFETDPPTQI